ncbi:hypothetical protein POM88_009178 [Heracleum sosnowskyi]|uniref:AIPP2-like SPOC-like domain-containing protein n=1 Tax=Heracleum sosnowskyi TaxID=360622 RepID=A0AAD8N2G2_9APIA|nr:hypothetical protein POM88_009178 [Heracleum sosnowskyi]
MTGGVVDWARQFGLLADNGRALIGYKFTVGNIFHTVTHLVVSLSFSPSSPKKIQVETVPMPDLVETHMGKVCDTCGDIGVEGALVTCPQCKVGCEHLYCMSEFSMAAPADWCCEMCRSSDLALSDRGLKKVSSEDVSCNPSPKLPHYDVTCNLSTKMPHHPKEYTDRQKFCKGARANWHEKAVGKGKTKYLWTNEVKNMPSGEKKGEPTHLGLVSSKPSKSLASGQNIGRMNPRSIIQADSSYMVKRYPKFGPSRYSEHLHPTRSDTSKQKYKELNSILTPVKEHGQMRQTSSVKEIKPSHAKKQKEMGETTSASQMSRRTQTCDITKTDATPSRAIALTPTEVAERTNGHLQKTVGKEPCADCQSPMSAVKLTKDTKPKNSDVGDAIHTVKQFYIKAAAEEPLPTDPAPDASWMGNFKLKDVETIISLSAHPTSQGLSKGCDPDDEDIGLYFFPDNRTRPDVYISHLEQLSGNYFLRSCIDGVELLVFTSKVLHKDYRKRNKCDFLWGMYRHRHRKLKGAAEETMVVDMDVDMEVDMDVDMEVDMVGGEIVGTIDVVVQKQSIDSNIDVPPGFNPSMRGQWKSIPPIIGHVASGKQDGVPQGTGFLEYGKEASCVTMLFLDFKWSGRNVKDLMP